MIQNFLNYRKASGSLLGGLAAYAYYKYSKMSAEDKSKLAQTIKDTGKSILNQIVPGGVKNTAAETEPAFNTAPQLTTI